MHACMHGLTIASRPHDWMKSKSDTTTALIAQSLRVHASRRGKHRTAAHSRRRWRVRRGSDAGSHAMYSIVRAQQLHKLRAVPRMCTLNSQSAMPTRACMNESINQYSSIIAGPWTTSMHACMRPQVPAAHIKDLKPLLASGGGLWVTCGATCMARIHMHGTHRPLRECAKSCPMHPPSRTMHGGGLRATAPQRYKMVPSTCCEPLASCCGMLLAAARPVPASSSSSTGQVLTHQPVPVQGAAALQHTEQQEDAGTYARRYPQPAASKHVGGVITGPADTQKCERPSG